MLQITRFYISLRIKANLFRQFIHRRDTENAEKSLMESLRLGGENPSGILKVQAWVNKPPSISRSFDAPVVW
jgi:hypothetical protein